ncbi:nucleotide-binding universal stress UspA family protein [Loktanella sp. PT4BL]|jgi:nucleotide-binding universal stress UspA family protein|uniref:universal stress protein n=1 Tax=Loktanella sp. PT4BL TaxID=2135611 RepID=UPI000D76617A|nr:universal stress protein [Loktanella sp. PT4BL]PXW68062.1 nucleotide-binding universal stress UspA family protein [Loktanella sp. PT4BL]
MTSSQPRLSVTKDQRSNAKPSIAPSDVLVFIEDGHVSEASINHAQHVARALGGSVELLQVICETAGGDGPTDPVDWDIKKHLALKRLDSLSKTSLGDDAPCRVRLLEGERFSQIKSLMDSRTGDIAASLRSRSDGGGYLGETAWALLISKSAAVLMIPDTATGVSGTPYRRIMVPLDGSPRAESALPMAVKIAQADKAEVMLCYVPPDTGLTEISGASQEALDLHDQVRRLNTKAGKGYLERTKKRIAHNGLTVSVKVSKSGDARRSLIDTMSREDIDFVVMATHGQSGHLDVPTGDVARFVLEKANIPVLLVRNRNGHFGSHTFGHVSSKGVRKPTGTD